MNISKAIRERRSIRDFKKSEVPNDVIDKLIDALIWAPSAGNLQARKFYFIREKGLKKKIATAALKQHFLAEAPLLVVGCTDSCISYKYGGRGVSLYSIQDVSCSLMGMMLVAHENGLGSVWVGAFDEVALSETLKLQNFLRPVAIVAVGYPSKIPVPPPRVTKDRAVEFR
jgi:nitroreductase